MGDTNSKASLGAEFEDLARRITEQMEHAVRDYSVRAASGCSSRCGIWGAAQILPQALPASGITAIDGVITIGGVTIDLSKIR